MTCFLREHAEYLSCGELVPLSKMVGMRDCEGPITRAHLIPRQQLRRAVIRLPNVTTNRAVKDKRLVVDACLKHHHLLDTAKKIRLTRELLPAPVEEAAEEYGLLWWLEREYGSLEVAA